MEERSEVVHKNLDPVPALYVSPRQEISEVPYRHQAPTMPAYILRGAEEIWLFVEWNQDKGLCWKTRLPSGPHADSWKQTPGAFPLRGAQLSNLDLS